MPVSRSISASPTLRRSALALAALAFAAVGSARAQSLQALYEAARAYDAAYLSAQAQADSTQYKAEQARAARLPVVNATAGVQRQNADTPYSSTSSSHTTSKSVGVTAQQSLFNRTNDKTIAQAERAVEVARAQLMAAEQDLIVRVAQAYFDVLGARDTLDSVQTGKKAIAEQLASAKRNFEVGTATITDTREAQARYDLATAQELAADNDLRVKRLALDQLTGRANVQPLPLAQPVALPALQPAQVDDWASTADGTNPSIQQARLAYDVAKLETEKARAGHLPTVGMTASYTSNNVDVSGVTVTAATGARPFALSGTGPTSAIGVQVNIPLFAGFAIENRVKETVSLEEKARNDLEVARRSVAQATRQAFFGVQSGQARVKALEAAESSSKLALEATQLGYKVGVRVNLDVLNAQTQLYSTQTDLAKARYDVIVGGLKLRQASGQLSPNDVNAVNALIAK